MWQKGSLEVTAIEMSPSYILVNAPVVIRIKKEESESNQYAEIIYQGSRTKVPLRDEQKVLLAEFTLGEPGQYTFQVGNISQRFEVHPKEEVSFGMEISILGLCVLVILLGFIKWDRKRKKSVAAAGSI